MFGPETCIGVLGGGQLGRMLALEARRMGLRVLKWTGGDESGAARLADVVLTDPFGSASALQRFLDFSDVATVEFENVPRELLETVEEHLPLMPSSKAVGICQNRIREKSFLADHELPTTPFRVVRTEADLALALTELGADAILKTAEAGYDGKGQRALRANASEREIASAWTSMNGVPCVLEKKVDLAAELSVIVARSTDGTTATYDATENVHRNHILHMAFAPSRAPTALAEKAEQLASRIAVALDYVGVLGVEFFVDGHGELLVNELAPRPHNSGHHTIDACETSQFEQQLRCILGLPLGSTKLIRPAVMWNLLGELWPNANTPPNWSPVFETPGAKLHLYGKHPAKAGRKMGHVTFTASTLDEALARAEACSLSPLGPFGEPNCAVLGSMSRDSERRQGL